MGQKTDIQWCDSTANPTAGCQGCELWTPGKGGPCYAGAIHNRFSPSKAYPGPFEEISLHPGRMAQAARWSDLTGKSRPDKPWLDGMPRIIFVSDMADALSRGVPFEYLADEIIVNVTSEAGQRHIWMWLTKLPNRMAEFSWWLEETHSIAWPENLWAGTSITGQKTTSRIRHLASVKASTRFVSAEPLWEEVDLRRMPNGGNALGTFGGVQLVIVGGQSGPDARPFDLAWARKLRDDCKATGVSYFLKQLGARPFFLDDDGAGVGPVGCSVRLRDSHGGAWEEWPKDLRVRQFPRIPSPAEAKPWALT